MSNIYRDNLGAALACVDSLKPKAITTIPKKINLFQCIRELFISQPERWTDEKIWWRGEDTTWRARDGWVIDLPSEGQQSVGFYYTGLFWIRIGEVRRDGAGDILKIHNSSWTYVFCPRFRRTVREIKNQRMLGKLR